MRVYEIIAPLVAYSFVATEDGNNLKELTEDVANDGGVVIANGDNAVIIKVGAGEFTVPIGFALLVDGGVGKIISQQKLEQDFVFIDGANDGVDLSTAYKRISALEAMVELLDGRLKAVEAKGAETAQPKTTTKKPTEPKTAEKA